MNTKILFISLSTLLLLACDATAPITMVEHTFLEAEQSIQYEYTSFTGKSIEYLFSHTLKIYSHKEGMVLGFTLVNFE